MTSVEGVQGGHPGDRYRPLLLLLLWTATCAWLVADRWAAIRGFGLPDTDDNLRMMQVRALIEGQGWYDLRQYRLDPPAGADIHWSRLVDLPIAGIKLLLAPLLGGRIAELAAVTIAPLLPMLVAMAALAVAIRRMVSERILMMIVMVTLIACSSSMLGMWKPLRIDHHGWQLAMLAVALAALTDPRRARGGVLLGGATALSLAIGMEMLLYLALAGAATVLRWVLDREEARRLAGYGAALGGGCALAYLIFASEANRAPVCDALSPVWLSAMVAAGALAVVLALLGPAGRGARFAAAAAAGVVLAGAFALTWPHCLGRLEGSTPELEQLWLSRVREAMPVWRHGWRAAAMIAALPVAGLIGYGLMLWRHRHEPNRMFAWAAIALPALLAAALLLWQTRAAAAAQLLSIPGATALVHVGLAWLQAPGRRLPRLAVAILFFLVIGAPVTGAFDYIYREAVSDFRRSVQIANARCPTLAALRPVAQQPPGTVLTFLDLGPRLVAVTPHSAIAGPYHRNATQIIDVMRTWRGDEANARATVERYRVDYVLICPNLSESTIHRAEAPQGFYARLVRGQVPDWLETVPLPAGSPYRMWRVARGRPPS